ncbi:hypothetical protein RJ640_028534 [Escallonia rubra]|uniref:GDSL esterase/lipase n=1 Tax=Escallonia rubra TaxID=112253 RepID=A0AA88R8N9_9ASTE|nr:hypothetical protein RJ640_028534 [Escallonia rubra]
MACCGYGGPPLNFEKRIDCGQTKILNGTLVTAGGCNDSSKYVNWDGIHYTEASNRYVSAQILSGKYFVPLIINLKEVKGNLKNKIAGIQNALRKFTNSMN